MFHAASVLVVCTRHPYGKDGSVRAYFHVCRIEPDGDWNFVVKPSTHHAGRVSAMTEMARILNEWAQDK